MAKKTIKKEYVILGVVIIALLFYLVLRNQNKVHFKVPELEPVEIESISKVDIQTSDKTITLVRKDQDWVIDPQQYPTDKEKVDKITETISRLALTMPASSKKSYTLYGLDEKNVIRVKVYQKDESVREFEIGKVTASRNHTFVKLKGDDKVYHAKESFRDHFEQKVDDLRDKMVMSFDKNEISEIEFDNKGEKLLFTKTVKKITPEQKKKAEKEADKKKEETTPPVEQTETTWSQKDGTPGKTSEFDSLLGQLSDLKCDGYIYDKKKEDLTEPIYSLKLRGKKEYLFTIYNKPEQSVDDKTESAKYPAVSSESSYPFTLSTYTAERIMKKPEDLLEKKEAVETGKL